jgi:hypothetical protein
VFRKAHVAAAVVVLTLLMPRQGTAQDPGETFPLDARIAMHAVQGLVELHVDAILRGLHALASNADVQSGEWSRLQAPLTWWGRTLPDAAAVFFAHPDGSYYTVAQGETGENLKSRPYFPVLMEGGDVQGSLVVSKSTGVKAAIIAAPIRREGAIVGALGVSVSVDRLSKLIADRLRLPSNVVFYALAGDGTIALHNDPSMIFAKAPELGDAALKAEVERMLGGDRGVSRYTFRGMHRIAVFEKSPSTGWVFAVAETRSTDR